jgi:Reverse transcriptase (RNA-dependent DNA polymerase)
MKVINTFLQGALEEKVYMTLPSDYDKEEGINMVCKLRELIYGLKQSPRIWCEKFNSHLISYDFKISNADHSLFVKYDHTYITVILVYVDGIIIIKNNEKNIKQIKNN